MAWADTIGPSTRQLVENILGSSEYPLKTYRACMGVMRLTKSHSADLMEKASQEAVAKNICSYKYFDLMLKQMAHRPERAEEKIIHHDNVRGSRAYQGGGIHA